jgi:hypothetical protein
MGPALALTAVGLALRRLLLTDFSASLAIVPGLLETIFGRLIGGLLLGRRRGFVGFRIAFAIFGHRLNLMIGD